MHDVILGLAKGYPRFVLDRFCATARRAGCTSRIALWTDEATLQHEADFRRAYDVELRPCPEFPYHAQTGRYLAYEQFLAEAGSAVRNALLCDVRDVLFRRDPFAHPLVGRSALTAFLEQTTIGESAFNAAWIRQAFGDEVFVGIASQPVSCSGTTLGTADGIRRYLARLNAIAQQLHASGRPITTGLDQGIHNGMLYHERLLADERVLSSNQDGLVFTMGYAPRALAADGWPVLPGHAPACMIHQYDRMNWHDVQQLGAVLDVEVSDHLQQRAPIREGADVAVWVAIDDGQGQPLARFAETARANVMVARAMLGDRVVDELCQHHLGDTVLIPLPELPPALRDLGGPTRLPKSMFARGPAPRIGAQLSLRDPVFALRRLVVTGVAADAVEAAPDLAPRANGFRVTLRVA